MPTELDTYASIVWEPSDLIELRPLQPWQGQRVWTLVSDLPMHFERMHAENERGANIYAGILPRKRDGGGTAEDVDGGRVVWVDLDHCDPDQASKIVDSIGLPCPSMVVATGHGAHLFWRLSEWADKATIQTLVSGLISFLLDRPESQKYIDKSAKDPARILRLPGFVNHKPPAAKSRIVFSNAELRYKPEDFSAFLPREPERKSQSVMQPGSGNTIRKLSESFCR